ncbi:phosphoglycerate dehydrogenase [Paratrimastix pyriformis]|uniref:Phosphoglycerate dehydrogenase n=1 Tax=Paratrimastix pyriformis TaxID=342808 RepID=A0ABQ8UHT1_9EUKA|nr:phosphoglycerate dehydrogenase [Paratrimastix pyriformis]
MSSFRHSFPGHFPPENNSFSSFIMAKILIVDQFSQEAQEQIRAAGHTVVYDTAAKGAKLTEKIAAEKPAVLVVRSTKVEAAQLDAGLPELRMVIRAGSGVDTIDVAGAKTRGIKVCNCPGKNAVAVAELAFGLMMAIDRRIVENVVQFRAGQWNKEAFTECRGLKGRTLGLVGCGNIGKEIAKRAIAFDMHVIVYDPFLQPAQIEAIGARAVPAILDVAANADVISIHVPGGAATKKIVGEAFFAAMRPGSYLINTSRSSVVDEAALINAVHTKGIWAGVDVMDNEPQVKKGPFQHPFAAEEHIMVTHHIGASTRQAEEAIGEEALRMVLHFGQTGEMLNPVN